MRRLKSIIDKLNGLAETYKSLIEVLGIFTGLILLALTFWSTLISKDLLRLSQQEELNKQLPIWDFEVIDSISIIKVKPFLQDMKIQRANFYYPKEFNNEKEWPIDPPKFKMHLTMAKWKLEELYKRKINYSDTNYIYLGFRNRLPIGLEINYIQYGESRTVYGLYMIQYLLNQKDNSPKIELEGVLFEKYCTKKELFDQLDTFSEDLKNEINKSDRSV